MGAAIAKVAENLASVQDAAIVAYGGAGGLHACDIASASPIKKIIMTPFSAVSSAYSSSLLDAGHLYYQRIDQPLSEELQPDVLENAISKMMKEAVRDMRGEGFAAEMLFSELQLFVRAREGEREVLLLAPTTFYSESDSLSEIVAQAKAALLQAGENPAAGMQLATVALMVRAPVPHFVQPELEESSDQESSAIKSTRSLYVGSLRDYVDAPIYDRAMLSRGAQLAGPALVESNQTTILVSENWQMTIDQYNNAILEEVQA